MPEVNGIRDYNRIRRFLGNIYLYGFFSREDFARCGIGSVKDYDYGSALIRSIFPDTEEAALWQEGKKYLRLARSYARSGEERLSDSYLLHSLDEREELADILYLLSFLRGGRCTPDDLNREMELHVPGEETSRYSTIRRRALELCEAGYLEKQGRYFSLRPDPFDALSDGALRQVHAYLCFCCGVTYPRVAGSYLRRSAERALARRGLSVPETSPFLLRHSVSANVFDEEMVYQLLDLIREGRSAEATMRLPGRPQASVPMVPVALRAETRLGRWYAVFWDSGREAPRLCRVRDIYQLRPGPAVPPERLEALRRKADEAFADTLCSGLPGRGKPVVVEARLCFDGAPGMRAQFLRELRVGAVERRKDGCEYYRAALNDPLELLPLLRAYAPWLRLLPGKHDLARRLRADLLALRAGLEETEP